jgi:phosphoglycolate phosphatase
VWDRGSRPAQDAAPVRMLSSRAMPATLLLDLDGTLTDPRPGIVGCIQHALRGAGLPVPPEADLLGWIGPPLLRSFQGLTGDAALAERCLALYRERFGAVGYRENAVYPAIPAVLTALRAAGHRLLLATSKPLVYAERILEHFGLAQYFTAAYGAGLDGSLADKDQLIAAILERQGLVPGACLMVGDRAHDVRGAAANGMACIGVLYGYGSAEELERAGACALVAQPEELPAVVAALAA